MMSETGLSDEQVVRQVYPDAYLYANEGIYQALNRTIHRGLTPCFRGIAIGEARSTPEEAWADARAKLPVAPKPQEERSDEHQARKLYKGRASYEFMSRGEFQCDGFRVTVAGHTIAECEDSEVADWICQQWNRSAALHESTPKEKL